MKLIYIYIYLTCSWDQRIFFNVTTILLNKFKTRFYVLDYHHHGGSRGAKENLQNMGNIWKFVGIVSGDKLWLQISFNSFSSHSFWTFICPNVVINNKSLLIGSMECYFINSDKLYKYVKQNYLMPRTY